MTGDLVPGPGAEPGTEPPTVDLSRARPTVQLNAQPQPAAPVGSEPPTVHLSVQAIADAGARLDAAQASCPACGEPVWPEDNFCESCRTELSPAVLSASAASPARCPNCPDARVSPEGYCEQCGHKLPAGTDHLELDLAIVAGVTDRGIRHHRNEDAMALATAQTPSGPVALAVVCDGVSSSTRPDEAAQAAAQAAIAVLLTAARTGEDLTAAYTRAFGAAQQAVLALTAQEPAQLNTPAATFVSAVMTSQDVTVCWLGDSRAYWLDERGAAQSRQLTSDDSVASELVARGLLSASEALASPAGHVVTGWIGADMSDATAHVLTYVPDGRGAVLLCSDGLWNYEPEAADLASRALPTALTDPIGTAAALVRFAVDAGGSDNITVVLAPFPPARAVPTAKPEEVPADEPE
jgi:serine/threonine protein phosphatase PrpC